MLDAEAALRGVAALTKEVGEVGARAAGLRLAKGALVLKIERGDAMAQVRIANAGAFNPDSGLVLRCEGCPRGVVRGTARSRPPAACLHR